ncbi:hypothetical protein CBW65_23640 [Tumebacillus avium]|uniref:Uncharacterized protein n=1 Tax=Tumebacillus avium TaxID=1903704 RepID=A0A1Y0ISU7_9BACL|nr:hypothetical protein [Tumebacillus avium]ARU63678.1 hypothetical protein CBW65_23640 [Tumebacillus avium]
MNKRANKIGIFAFLLLLVFGCLIYWYYVISDLRGQSELESQINHLVAIKDQTEILRIAQDSKTADFINQLPPDTKCEKTTDAQGKLEDGSYYYSTLLNNRPLSVYLEKTPSGSGILDIPKWKVIKVVLR